jgi:methionine--tRNA ligase beta chain
MSISYEDFAKVEIRIGTIETVELVEGADRLLKLTVDVGEESKRQIVSGIREYFADPQELVGKQCPFLVNLETRTIRGFDSEGMILAGGEKGMFTLLHPHKHVPAGIRVQ